MEYINLHVSVIDSDAFKGATPTQRGTWICLIRYLVGQENGDTISNCRAWGDRKWQQVCAVTLEEVNDECDLWKWNGDDLEVNFYPEQAEKQTRAMRKGGVIGNKRRWGKKHIPESPPDKPPHTPPDATPESPGASITKRNETKRNETPQVAGGGKFPESVSDDLVIQFGQQFPGEPASGAPPMPPEWVNDFIKRLNGRREWPGNWQRWMVSCWRSEFRKWEGNEKSGGEKTGGSRGDVRIKVQAELDGVREQMEAMRSPGFVKDDDYLELERREADLRKELEGL